MTNTGLDAVKVCPLIVQAKGDDLLVSFKEEKKNPNIRTRLALISQGCALLADHVTLENRLKINALTVIVRDKASAGANNGHSRMANMGPQRTLPARDS